MIPLIVLAQLDSRPSATSGVGFRHGARKDATPQPCLAQIARRDSRSDGPGSKNLHPRHERRTANLARYRSACADGAAACYLCSQPQMEGDMTPERPRRADATDARSRRPIGPVSRADEPSAPDQPTGSAPLYAALDLGTNSCRMLIAQPKGSQFIGRRQLFQDRAAGRGAGGLGPAVAGPRWGARSRRCGSARRRSKSTASRRMRLVATEACRRARNATRLHPAGAARDRAAAGDHRARGRGAAGGDLLRAAGQPTTEQLLVVDIGGGSTELVWIDLSAVAPVDRPRAIMRLHMGFNAQGEAPWRGWWTGFRCRWAWRR